MEKIIIHYHKMDNWWTRTTSLKAEQLSILETICNLKQIANMLQVCDMFRLKVCEYYVRWYTNGNKAKLEITIIKSYDTQRI